MTELKSLNSTQLDALSRPLPDEAVSPHPTKKYLSSIKSIYVTERLNEVFGGGKWRIETEIIERADKMFVVKLKFSIPDYGIYYECYGGNDNSDLGDAYKGATTDAITKVASWLGVGADVFKGKHARSGMPQKTDRNSQSPTAAPVKKRITPEMLADEIMCDSLLKWAYNAYTTSGYSQTFDAGAKLLKSYDADADVVERFTALFESYRQARKNAK